MGLPQLGNNAYKLVVSAFVQLVFMCGSARSGAVTRFMLQSLCMKRWREGRLIGVHGQGASTLAPTIHASS